MVSADDDCPAFDVRTEHREWIGMTRPSERVEVGVGSHCL
jgi:hypothetical protein